MENNKKLKNLTLLLLFMNFVHNLKINFSFTLNINS